MSRAFRRAFLTLLLTNALQAWQVRYAERSR